MESRLQQVKTQLKNLLEFIKSSIALPSIIKEIQKAEGEKRRLTIFLKAAAPTTAQIIPRAMDNTLKSCRVWGIYVKT